MLPLWKAVAGGARHCYDARVEGAEAQSSSVSTFLEVAAGLSMTDGRTAWSFSRRFKGVAGVRTPERDSFENPAAVFMLTPGQPG